MKRKILLVGVVLGSIFVLLLVFFLFMRPSVDELRVTPVELTYSDNFSRIDDSYLYSFNGMSFYKIDLENGDVSILQSGMKLPRPDSITWTKSGAFLTFSESFWLSEVQLQVLEQGADILDASYRDYSWYLDFESSELSVASEEKPVSRAAVSYDGEETIYFLTESDEGYVLNTYNVDSGDTSQIKEVTGLIDVEHIERCSTAYEEDLVCLTARSAQNTARISLYAVSNAGDMSERYSIEGRLFPTNRPGAFIAVDRGELDEGQSLLRDIEQADIFPGEVVLYNAVTEEEIDLGYESNSSSIIGSFTGDKSFYIFDESLVDSQSGSVTNIDYIQGLYDKEASKISSSRESLLYNDGSIFLQSFIMNNNQFTSEYLLFTTSSGGMAVLHPENKPVSLPETKESSTIADQIQSCTQYDDLDVDFAGSSGTHRIFFTENESYSEKVEEIAGCMATKHPESMYNNYYYFGARDSVTGRITTD